MIVLQFFSFKEATKNKVALASLSIFQGENLSSWLQF
jgi:hypothetical protein